MHIWHAGSGAKLATLPPQVGGINEIVFSPNGELLVWSSRGQLHSSLSFWDVPKGRLLDSFLAHKSYLDRLSFSPDGRILASASGDSSVKLWDVASRKLLGSLQGHRQSVFAVAFSHDGRLMASESSDGTIKLWNIALQQEAATIKFDETGREDIDSRIWRVEFAPDDNTLAGLSWGNQLKLWHAPPLADIQADERKLADRK
jgi:WD40 repeat protein